MEREKCPGKEERAFLGGGLPIEKIIRNTGHYLTIIIGGKYTGTDVSAGAGKGVPLHAGHKKNRPECNNGIQVFRHVSDQKKTENVDESTDCFKTPSGALRDDAGQSQPGGINQHGNDAKSDIKKIAADQIQYELGEIGGLCRTQNTMCAKNRKSAENAAVECHYIKNLLF